MGKIALSLEEIAKLQFRLKSALLALTQFLTNRLCPKGYVDLKETEAKPKSSNLSSKARFAIPSLLLLLASCSSENDKYLYPQVELGPVPGDADDCAIWVDPQDGSRSVVVGNDKTFAGGLYVWDLSGKLLSFVPMVRPINLDVRHGMPVGGESVNILAVGERISRNVRIFKIDPKSRELIDITKDGGIPTGFDNDIYGLTLYRQKGEGKYYVFVSEKTKGTMIHQILLEDDGNGKVKGTIVRKFGGTV
ncbi:MAG: phytase, partial [Chlamydiota bacterium]